MFSQLYYAQAHIILLYRHILYYYRYNSYHVTHTVNMKTSTTAATKCPRRSSFYFILCMAVLSISSVCAGHKDALLNPPNDNDDDNNQNQEVFSTLITRGSNTDADMTANPNHLPKIDICYCHLAKGLGSAMVVGLLLSRFYW